MIEIDEALRSLAGPDASSFTATDVGRAAESRRRRRRAGGVVAVATVAAVAVVAGLAIRGGEDDAVVAGPSSSEPETTTSWPYPPGVPRIINSVWSPERVTIGGSTWTPPASVDLVMSLEWDGPIHVALEGCDSQTAYVEFDDSGRLELRTEGSGDSLDSSRRPCDGPEAEADQVMLGVLRAMRTWSVDGEVLTVRGDDGLEAMLRRYHRQWPDQPAASDPVGSPDQIVDRWWAFRTVEVGDLRFAAEPKMDASLILSEQDLFGYNQPPSGMHAWTDGCNGPAGRIDIGPGTLRVPPGVLVGSGLLRGCDSLTLRADRIMQRVLEQVETWSLEGDVLTLRGPQMLATLDLMPEPPVDPRL